MFPTKAYVLLDDRLLTRLMTPGISSVAEACRPVNRKTTTGGVRMIIEKAEGKCKRET